MATHAEKFRNDLLKKLPTTGAEGERILLGVPFFKSLTDTEFIILWNTPGLDIVVGPNAEAYIKQRQAKLKLQESKNIGFNTHENQEG